MLRVLIVDDEVSARTLVSNLLRQLPECKVVGEAANGFQALDKVDELHPNVVLADVMMPEMDGIALAARIRERYPEVQVIMLTMYSDFSYAVEAMRSGAIDYILKDSYDVQPLMRAMEKVKKLLRKQSEQDLILRKQQLEEQAGQQVWRGKCGRFFIPVDQKYRQDPVREAETIALMVDISHCAAAGEGFWFLEGESVPSVLPGLLLGRMHRKRISCSSGKAVWSGFMIRVPPHFPVRSMTGCCKRKPWTSCAMGLRSLFSTGMLPFRTAI